MFSIYLGDRLGYFRSLADGRAATPAELAEVTETDERYVREWLEQQAVTGFLLVDDAAAAPDERRYRLPATHAEVLANRDSLNYLAPAAVATAAAALQLAAVAGAFGTGDGVPWDAYGDDMRGSQGERNGCCSSRCSAPSGLRRSPTSTSASAAPVHALRTSASATAGRRSASRSHTRVFASTDMTSTRPPWSRRAVTPRSTA